MDSQTDFQHITRLISEAKQRAYQAVNHELVTLYWHIGEYLYQQVTANAWGKSIIKELADFIAQNEPNIKGFSDKNLWRMKQFYETYKDEPKLSALPREITWTHNTMIFSQAKSPEEREFYLRMSIRERWSSRELARQIDSACFERAMLSNNKSTQIAHLLPQDIKDTFKDTYVLEMLQVPEKYDEKDLKHQICQNISQFLLEFGRDFAFMGEEYPLQVGNQDFAIDLLFYNRRLKCLVAIELKIEKFKPEHLGKLNFYLEALDRDIKTADENPSIGILLCRGKDDSVVEYALSRSLSPTLIADYEMKLPNKKLLQQKWNEILDNLALDEDASI